MVVLRPVLPPGRHLVPGRPTASPLGDMLGGLPSHDRVSREQELQPTELLGGKRRRGGQLLGHPVLDLPVTPERGEAGTAWTGCR